VHQTSLRLAKVVKINRPKSQLVGFPFLTAVILHHLDRFSNAIIRSQRLKPQVRAKQLSPSCEPSRRTRKRDCFSHGEYECVSQQRQNAATELEEIEESGR